MIDATILKHFQTLPKKIIATVHKDPDYDAIGSLLALGTLINALGKDITLYSPDINIKQFKHLPGIKKIVRTPKSEYDLAIFLDCSDKSRISHPNDFPNTKKIINIDHHQDNTHFGDINIVHNISSVGEIIFNLYHHLDIDISTKTAIHLYAAICFDTGNFKFANTSSKTFIVASELVKKNINATLISEWIFEQKPKNYFEDIRTGLNNMYLDQDHPFMIVHIPHHPNISSESTINFFRQLENVELIIVCKEVRKLEYRISFRSKQTINVAKIAHHFNGGGHIRAAGATIQSSFSSLKTNLIKHARKSFQ